MCSNGIVKGGIFLALKNLIWTYLKKIQHVAPNIGPRITSFRQKHPSPPSHLAQINLVKNFKKYLKSV